MSPGKDLADWAESLLCNALPENHCSPEEWNVLVKRWRDEKHRIYPDGDEHRCQFDADGGSCIICGKMLEPNPPSSPEMGRPPTAFPGVCTVHPETGQWVDPAFEGEINCPPACEHCGRIPPPPIEFHPVPLLDPSVKELLDRIQALEDWVYRQKAKQDEEARVQEMFAKTVMFGEPVSEALKKTEENKP